MFQARSGTGDIIDPTPGVEATCPLCDAPVIAKCGRLVTWHFAHRAGADCDPWSEPETDWHRDWKFSVWPENREVTIRNRLTGERHRADMLAANGTVVELQHSPISVDEVEAREDFYRCMDWIFDVSDCRSNIIIDPYSYGGDAHSFRWNHPRKHIAAAGLNRENEVRVFLDLGYGRLFQLESFSLERDSDRQNGAGVFVRRSDYIHWLTRKQR